MQKKATINFTKVKFGLLFNTKYYKNKYCC